MTQVQSGLLLERCRHAIFLEAKLHSGTQELSEACTQFCSALQALQQQFPDARLGAVVAFGPQIWQALSQGQGASELKPFVELGQGLAPATQRDLLIHSKWGTWSVFHRLLRPFAQYRATTTKHVRPPRW